MGSGIKNTDEDQKAKQANSAVFVGIIRRLRTRKSANEDDSHCPHSAYREPPLFRNVAGNPHECVAPHESNCLGERSNGHMKRDEADCDGEPQQEGN